MATIATLMVRIEGNEKPLKKSMKAAERSATTMATRMKRVSKDVAASFARMAKGVNLFKVGLVAVAGFTALGLLVKKTLATADAITKTADKIGIATDTLQEFRFAAGISGVSVGMMDNSLAKFSKNMGELGLTSSTTQTALKDLDKTLLADLRATSDFNTQLDLAFKALANVEDHSKRAAVAVALFGRSGQGILNLVGHVERLRQVSRDIKVIVPENLLRDAARANDQMSMLAQILGAKLSIAILKNADAIANFTERLIEAIPAITRGAEEFARFIGLLDETDASKVNRELGEVADRISDVGRQLRDLQTGGMALGMSKFFNGAEAQSLMGGLKQELIDLKARHAELMQQIATKPAPLPSLGVQQPGLRVEIPGNLANTAALIKSRENTEAFKASMAEAGKALTTEMLTPTEAYSARIRELNAMVEAGAITNETYARSVSRAQDELIKSRENTEAFKASMVEAGKALTTEMLTPTEAYSARIRELNALVEAGAIGNETYARSVSRAQDELATAAAATDQLTASQERLASVADSTFDRIIAGASSASEILRALAIDMGKALLLNLSGGKSFGQLLVGGISDLFPGKAAGGPVQSNQPYVVGEKGPELMVPGASGSIVPNNKLGGTGGGGTTIVQNFNISTGVAPTVRSEIMNLMPVIKAEVKQSIMADQTRGGPLFAKR